MYLEVLTGGGGAREECPFTNFLRTGCKIAPTPQPYKYNLPLFFIKGNIKIDQIENGPQTEKSVFSART